MEASLSKTKILSSNLEQKTTSSAENKVFKTLIACDENTKAKNQDNSLLASTEGLPASQKKTADNLIASLRSAEKKFQFKSALLNKSYHYSCLS
jgi:hypothetical protein